MKIMFLLNFFVSLAIFLILAVNFFKHYKKEKIRQAVKYLFIVGILYLIVSLFSALWYFDILFYDEIDFMFIYALVILVQTLFLLMIVYMFLGNKRLFYFLFFYLIIFISFFTSVLDSLYLFLITSFLLTLLFFIRLCFTSRLCRRTGYLGVFYAIISVFFNFLLMFGIGDLYVFSLFLNLVFLFLIYQVIKDLKKKPLARRYSKFRKTPKFIVFLRYFVFILILTNFVFITTIAMHEFGHLAVSKFYSCEHGKIVYEVNFPHTEVLCQNLQITKAVILGGPLLPFAVALVLFIIGGRFIKDISLLITGFNLIGSGKDLAELGVSDNLILVSMIFGILILVLGIIMLSRSRTEDYFFVRA